MKKSYRYRSAEDYFAGTVDTNASGNLKNDVPLFVFKGEEAAYKTECETTKDYEEVRKMMDETDLAMIAETARSGYLISLQVYQFCKLRGLAVSRQGIRNRLNKLVKYQVLREYTLKIDDFQDGIRYYDLAESGIRMAREEQIALPEGYIEENRYADDPENVKRILACNMIFLGLLQNGAALKGFEVLESTTHTYESEWEESCQDDLSQTSSFQTTGMFWSDEESVFLLEVIRNSEDPLDSLLAANGKVEDYYKLLHKLRTQNDEYPALPQLVICAETYEESRRIDAYIRKHYLWNEKDTILYTHDLLYMKNTLRFFYTFDKKGKPVWYELPSRFENSAENI